MASYVRMPDAVKAPKWADGHVMRLRRCFLLLLIANVYFSGIEHDHLVRIARIL